jgi:DNA-directed RNA polymerase specialized sigma24 family protein
MPSKAKTSRRETTIKERRVVWTRYLDGKHKSEIARLENLPWSTIANIIKRAKLSTGKD